MTTTKYKRVLLKLSGEAFSGEADYGIDAPTLARIAKQTRQVIEMGTGVAIVVGGGTSGVGLRLSRMEWIGSLLTTPGC